MSRSEAAVLLKLAESIADGSPIDWEAAEASASHEEKAVIRELRILSNLSALHRSMPADSMSGAAGAFARRDSAAPAIGRWAHLTLVERLGGGTFGDVYRAWDRHLEREVALKLLRADAAAGDLSTSRIANEGRLLARIRHHNVITVHGVDVHDDRVGLWMDLVRGATLEQQLAARGLFSAGEAAAIGIDLCRALAAIHAAGLIHRDVKAQNVMREEGGRIVLMDLGTGRDAERGVPHGVPELAGTPLYLAPEIFTGAPAGARTDLYSLGVLLYHLVTGAFPVRATTIDQLQAAHASGAAVRLRDVRADLPTMFVRVVDRAIAREAAARYQSAGELEADLADAVTDTRKPADAEGRSDRFRRLTAWPSLALAAAAVVVVLALLALPWPPPFLRAPASIRSIAVLPLVNLSGDASQDYFADGMTDELIGTLGRLGGVNVISRTSTMQFKGSTKTAPEIARALKVDAVLEGSVRVLDDAGSIGPTGGKRVRINARLIYAGSDTQLWDRTFENVAADVLALQSNVAKAVADGIKVKLATTSPRQAVNPQAYDTYLRGRYLWNKRTPEDLRRALDEFKRAISLDPTAAVAWSGLADAYLLLANQSEMAPLEAMPRAAEAARKAVELDPALAEARVSLATIAWSYDWQFDRAEQEYASALSLNPSYATGHAWHALYLAYSGQTAEAILEMQRAQRLDPLALVNQINIARCYYFARQFDQAERLLRRVEEQEPSAWMVHAALGQTHLAQGEYDRAIAELTKARELSPASLRNLAVLGDAYGRSGRSADALAMARELARLSQSRFVPAAYSALIHIGLGDHSRALSDLERSRAERSEWVTQLDVEPEFDPLRGDPRFGAVLSGITSRTNPIAR